MCLALVLLALGAVLGYGNAATGVVLILAALGCLIAALFAQEGDGDRAVLLAVALFVALLVLLADAPLWTLVVVPVAAGWYWFARSGRWWWLGLLPAIALQVTATAVQWHWGRAAIDVFDTLQAATHHLLQGANPYAFQYRDQVPLPVFHFIQAPFQYGPTTLYLGAPGRLLGDVRVLAAAALVATVVALVVHARGHGAAALRRSSYLGTSLPLLVPLLVNAWVDVYTAAGLAIWWALRRRSWMPAAAALGVGAAAKPVMLVGLVPLLVWDRTTRRECLLALVVAVLLCVPFLIWTGPAKFVYAVAGVHISVLSDPWPTSISFDALLLRAHLPTIPDWIAILLVLVSIPGAMLWRPRESRTRLLAACALMTAALLLSRQSFLNYYYVVAIWLLLAIAEEPEAVSDRAATLHESSPPASRIAV